MDGVKQKGTLRRHYKLSRNTLAALCANEAFNASERRSRVSTAGAASRFAAASKAARKAYDIAFLNGCQGLELYEAAKQAASAVFEPG